MSITLTEDFFKFTTDLKQVYDDIKQLELDAKTYMEAYKTKKTELSQKANQMMAEWEAKSAKPA
jgi:hypothetical protein